MFSTGHGSLVLYSRNETLEHSSRNAYAALISCQDHPIYIPLSRGVWVEVKCSIYAAHPPRFYPRCVLFTIEFCSQQCRYWPSRLHFTEQRNQHFFPSHCCTYVRETTTRQCLLLLWRRKRNIPLHLHLFFLLLVLRSWKCCRKLHFREGLLRTEVPQEYGSSTRAPWCPYYNLHPNKAYLQNQKKITIKMYKQNWYI